MANKLLVALGVACVAFGECLELEFDVKVAKLVQKLLFSVCFILIVNSK